MGQGTPVARRRNGRAISAEARPRGQRTEGLGESRRTPRVVANRCQPLSLRPSAENDAALGGRAG